MRKRTWAIGFVIVAAVVIVALLMVPMASPPLKEVAVREVASEAPVTSEDVLADEAWELYSREEAYEEAAADEGDEKEGADEGDEKEGADETVRRVDELLDAMASASIAFNAPRRINIDDSPEIQLILSLAESTESLKAAITRAGERVGATVKVSAIMEARLTGQSFRITAITPEEQAISSSRRTEWQWEVQPRKEGAHELHLTLTALLQVDGRQSRRAVRTFDHIIDVEVTANQKVAGWFESNWQWLWAAILVPVAGWIWKRRRTKQG